MRCYILVVDREEDNRILHIFESEPVSKKKEAELSEQLQARMEALKAEYPTLSERMSQAEESGRYEAWSLAARNFNVLKGIITNPRGHFGRSTGFDTAERHPM